MSSETTGTLHDREIVELFQWIHADKITGLLEVESDENRRRFHFVQGELQLQGSHSLAQRLEALLEYQGQLSSHSSRDASDSGDGRADLLSQLQHVVERVADVVVSIEHGKWKLSRDVTSLPPDLIGPFPTAYLIMESAVRHRGPEQLLADLGGEDARVAAVADGSSLMDMVGLDPGEMFLLSRAEHPTRIGELLHQVSDRNSALRLLRRLSAVGLLCEVTESDAGPDSHETRLVETMVERFLDRVGRRLEADPLDLHPDDHRARLGKLLAQVGSMTHYELLQVGFHDSEEVIHEAYETIARLVHPLHIPRLRLVGREGAARLLFERATLAYITLADPERRARYNLEAGIEAPRQQSDEERTDEQRDVAQSAYARALDLLENEDYHFAIELVRQALRADPQAQYFALLGQILARNPNWVDKASDAYRNAVRLAPNDPTYRVELGRLMVRAGDENRAKVHFRAALQKDPANIEALEALQAMGVSNPLRRGGQGGLMGRLKRLFG